MKEIDIIYDVMRRNKLGILEDAQKQNTGFNRGVYKINDKYIFKISTDLKKKIGFVNELDFYSNSEETFHPSLIAADVSFEKLPYMYTIEEKISGVNLFDIWDKLSENQKEECLNKIVNILKKIHCRKGNCNYDRILDSFDNSLLKLGTIIADDDLEHLKILRDYISYFFKNASFGYIHGDIHFNNVLYDNGGIKIIDFEKYSLAPLDMEFDSIYRMTRNPNSLIQDRYQNKVNKSDYDKVFEFIVQNYHELSNAEHFKERLLIYDLINSMYWLYYYPNYELYRNIIFSENKSLVKVI